MLADQRATRYLMSPRLAWWRIRIEPCVARRHMHQLMNPALGMCGSLAKQSPTTCVIPGDDVRLKSEARC